MSKKSNQSREREQENKESIIWSRDKELVFSSCASFSVKILGTIAVESPKGVEICEQAVSTISYRKNKMKGNLNVFSDKLTFVEQKSNSLLIDQPIEKVAFCCALPNNNRIFCYISRDGMSKEWLCHVFVTVRGIHADRVSHACACAFSACLQKKQQERSKYGLPALPAINMNNNLPAPITEGVRIHPVTESAMGFRRVHTSGAVPRRSEPIPETATNTNTLGVQYSKQVGIQKSEGDLLSSIEREQVDRRASHDGGIPYSSRSVDVNNNHKNNHREWYEFKPNNNYQNHNGAIATVSSIDVTYNPFSPVKKYAADPWDPLPVPGPSGNRLPQKYGKLKFKSEDNLTNNPYKINNPFQTRNNNNNNTNNIEEALISLNIDVPEPSLSSSYNPFL